MPTLLHHGLIGMQVLFIPKIHSEGFRLCIMAFSEA